MLKVIKISKRGIAFVLTILLIAGICNINVKPTKAAEAEVKAVWFSYIEIQEMLRDKNEAGFRQTFSTVCDNIAANGCNTIYAHVRAFSDAMYPSQYYPWSLIISSSGNALSYDPLAIMVEIAHSKGIKFHAWINPFRISINSSDTASLLAGNYKSATYQAKFNEWNNAGMVTQKVYNGKNCLFLNPVNESARNLITNGVREIVTKYAVDGVIFDDYFFVWDFSDASQATVEMAARKNYINMLVKSIYSTIKSVKSNVTFGISPEGNMSNARRQGCDIDTWLSESGYIDYIAPQIYWTDHYVTSSGTTAMFTNRLNSWVALSKNGIPVYPALALYRAGVESSTDKGWSESSSNLRNQWLAAQQKGCTGFSLFSYKYMLNNAGQAEMKNLTNTNVNYGDSSNGVYYQTHVQSYGWMKAVSNGESSGTTGQSKRLEAINISVTNNIYKGDITYRVHMQSYGWMNWVQNGADAGVTGKSKRMEAIEIKLTDELAEHYDVYYRVHAQSYGWLDWAKNGETAGTTGLSKRLEAIQIKLVPKGEAAPGNTSSPCVMPMLSYATHVQTYGWQAAVTDGNTAGTSGKAKRLEAITIKLQNQKYSGDIRYRVHSQTYGWMNWEKNGTAAGTSGQSKRLEAIQVELTGDMAQHYDVYYRVHCQTFGWQDWKKNGEIAGTTGMAKRLEAIEIKLVPKNN